MSVRVLAIAVAVAAGAFAVPAQAAGSAMTAGDLKELCSGSDHVSHNVCRVYILGVTEGITQGLAIAAANGAKACIPEDISAEQLEKTLKARLEQDLSRSPAQSTQDAAVFLGAALAEAFPCSAPKAAQH